MNSLFDWTPFTPRFQIILSERVSTREIFQAYFTVKYLQYLAVWVKQNGNKFESLIPSEFNDEKTTSVLFNEFITITESSGWDTSKLLLGDAGYRINFDSQDTSKSKLE